MKHSASRRITQGNQQEGFGQNDVAVASRRQKQAASRKVQQGKAESAAANDARSAREVVRNRTTNIQAHVQARGQRQQARRDSR